MIISDCSNRNASFSILSHIFRLYFSGKEVSLSVLEIVCVVTNASARIVASYEFAIVEVSIAVGICFQIISWTVLCNDHWKENILQSNVIDSFVHIIDKLVNK